MRKWISLPLLLSAMLTQAQPPAWFVSARLLPTDSTLAGIPLECIDPTLQLVKVPTLADLPPNADLGVAELKRGDYAFDVAADLNGDGIAERTLVGVYQARDGTSGRFIAILGAEHGPRTKVLLFRKIDTTAGFSFLHLHNNVLDWYGCLNCGYAGIVVWKHGRFSMEF